MARIAGRVQKRRRTARIARSREITRYAVPPDTPAEDRLRRFVRVRLMQTTNYRVVGESPRPLPRQDLDTLRELIVVGQSECCFRSGDPDIMAATIHGLLAQVCEWYRPHGRFDRETLIDEMVEFIVLGVREST